MPQESPRLPLDGPIPLCIKTGVVNFKWRSEAGIFQIPAPECPASYDLAANDTYKVWLRAAIVSSLSAHLKLCVPSLSPSWIHSLFLGVSPCVQEIAPVSDSGVFALTPDAVVGSYFFTSQVPGACESGTRDPH